MPEENVGNYRLANLLMTGQNSQVWEVVENSSHRHFAMKLLLPEWAAKSEIREMLFHEANIGIKMAHPNVIKILEVNKDLKMPFFVMEFFPAGSLKLRLVRKQLDFIREKLPSILRQAATGLAYMNASGFVHRDVKPDNLLVNSSGELRIIDFAIAQRIQKENFFSKLFRKKQKVQGTRSYMSPEQIRGEALDGRADIYSFGITCFELTTGRVPFRAASSNDLLVKQITEKPVSPASYDKNLTDQFCELVLKMLAKKREDRPESFHEVLRTLNAIKIYKNQA
ncbi:MAG: serine/threonine-protein kinase [Gemmataceae bacterium]